MGTLLNIAKMLIFLAFPHKSYHYVTNKTAQEASSALQDSLSQYTPWYQDRFMQKIDGKVENHTTTIMFNIYRNIENRYPKMLRTIAHGEIVVDNKDTFVKVYISPKFIISSLIFILFIFAILSICNIANIARTTSFHSEFPVFNLIFIVVYISTIVSHYKTFNVLSAFIYNSIPSSD